VNGANNIKVISELCRFQHLQVAQKIDMMNLLKQPQHNSAVTHNSQQEIWAENTKDSKLSYGDNPKSLSHLVLEQYRDVTDRHQDRITIANMRYS